MDSPSITVTEVIKNILKSDKNKIKLLEKLKLEIDKQLELLYGHNSG